MNKMKTLRASQVTAILIGTLIALICILIGSSVLAGTMLIKKSSDATHAQIDAQVSTDDPMQLEALKKYLADNAAGISQTAALTAGLGKYDQNSIIATINAYAGKAGITISSFSFGTGDLGSASVTPSTATPGGNTVDLTLGSPVPYRNFITFLQLLEQGLMPAQITSAQISPDTDTPSAVVVSSIDVQVAQ